ncbi:MAG TPA: divergent PAP2 family protein [Halanaerobiales bacterium]|nr:divergent PAP2 family protein [Halanaerobiales bacterium]
MNKILIVSLISLFLAQFLKIFTIKPSSFTNLFGSGGFPSSHSSFVATLSTLIGLKHGFNSDLFAIVLIFSLIVTYDASGVRRAVGEQANVLNNLIQHLNVKNIERDPEILKEDLKELIGHTPLEVFAGVLLGVSVAFISYYYFF